MSSAVKTIKAQPNEAKPHRAPVGKKRKQLAHDRELVRLCLQGNVESWEQMYKECQPNLLLNIRSLIRPHRNNTNLAEEIASRVWFSLLADNGSLLDRYDSHRGCKLTTFFAALARYELLKYWRGEKRRRNREQVVVRGRTTYRSNHAESFHVAWGEFVETLTSKEREFLEQVLIAPESNNGTAEISQANAWQLRSRVLGKLKRYSADGHS